MDLLYGLQGALAKNTEDAIIEDELPDFDPSSIPDVNPSQLPSPEELLKMLDGMTGLSDEDKESLREELTKNIQGGNSFGQNLPPPAAPFTSQALILLALLAVIALIFGNRNLLTWLSLHAQHADPRTYLIASAIHPGFIDSVFFQLVVVAITYIVV